MSDEDKQFSKKYEEYLESILCIVTKKGYARTKDVANALSITPASVVEMFKKLDDDQLVNYRKYEGVTLTPMGREFAKRTYKRHKIIKQFLDLIKVPREIADNDACIMDHHLTSATIGQIRNLIQFIEEAPISEEWLEQYKEFLNTGKINRNH